MRLRVIRLKHISRRHWYELGGRYSSGCEQCVSHSWLTCRPSLSPALSPGRVIRRLRHWCAPSVSQTERTEARHSL